MSIRSPSAAVVLLCLALPSFASAGNLRVDGQLISDAPPGTPPLAVGSTTTVGNLSADLLDGFDAADFLPAAGNVILVAKSGGHYTSIQAALDSIVGANSTNPYLVLVAPGVYVEQVTMEPYVDIQGSGQGVTTISWMGGDLANETLLGSDLAELRDLTVKNTGTADDNPWAIRNVSASPRISRVTAEAQTSGSGANAIRNEGGSSPVLVDVVATAESASAIAVNNLAGRLTMIGGEAHAEGDFAIAISNQATEGATLRRVTISASGLGSPQNRGIATDSGTTEAVDVDVTVADATTNTGIQALSGADLELTRVRVVTDGSAGSTCYAVQTIGGDLVLIDSELRASGCNTTNQGVRNDNGAVEISNGVILADSATAYGVHSYDGIGGGACTADIHGTRIHGTTRSVSTDTGCTSGVGASRLGVGAVGGGGTTVCAGVYDEATTFYASTCP